jgi:hypothetical protein
MSIEAMKLALEALGPTAPECCGCAVEWEIAITALRQAIEQDKKELEATERQVEILTDELANAQRRIEQFEQAQKQEPVAWVVPSWLNPDTRGWQSESFEGIPVKGWVPLYTSPPPVAEPHKPLTNLEIADMFAKIKRAENPYLQFARAIEAAHCIKGEE